MRDRQPDSGTKQVRHVASNHQLLVGADATTRRRRAAGRKQWTAASVPRCVDFRAEPGEMLDDGRAHGRRILADAAGENEGVEPAERGDERAGMTRGPVAKGSDRGL